MKEQIQIKVDESKKIWSTPDGEKTIFGVTLDDGREFKTWDKEIADSTEAIQAETWSKMNDRIGKEEHWLGVPGWKGSNSGGFKGKSSGGGWKGSGQKKSNASFAISYAKDVVIAEAQYNPDGNGLVDDDRLIQLADKMLKWMTDVEASGQ